METFQRECHCFLKFSKRDTEYTHCLCHQRSRKPRSKCSIPVQVPSPYLHYTIAGLDHSCHDGISVRCHIWKKVPPRTIAQVKSIPDVIHGTWDSDSYANTCVAGPNCIDMEYTDQVMNVSAYSDQLDVQQNVPIVTAAIAYDDPHTGTTYILVLGQAIYNRDPKWWNTYRNNIYCNIGPRNLHRRSNRYHSPMSKSALIIWYYHRQ